MTTTEQHYDYLISVIGNIRQKTGIGDKPMLSELADALQKEMRMRYWNGMFDAAEALAKEFEHYKHERAAMDIRAKAYEWAKEFNFPSESKENE